MSDRTSSTVFAKQLFSFTNYHQICNKSTRRVPQVEQELCTLME